MALPDLDDLIAEVDRKCETAHRPAGQEQFDWLTLLTVAAELAGQLHALAEGSQKIKVLLPVVWLVDVVWAYRRRFGINSP